MKNIVFAFIISVMTMPALAGTVFYVPNAQGGNIEFTDGQCSADNRFFTVMSYTASGKVIHGCYIIKPDTQDILVVWSDGDTYRYPMKDLKATEYFVENYGDMF